MFEQFNDLLGQEWSKIVNFYRVFALQEEDCASDRMREKKEDLEERLMPELKSLVLGTAKEWAASRVYSGCWVRTYTEQPSA